MEGADTGKALNDLARHQMIERLYRDILIDMKVCEIEGWDRMEFLTMLRKLIDSFFKRRKDGGGKEEDH